MKKEQDILKRLLVNNQFAPLSANELVELALIFINHVKEIKQLIADGKIKGEDAPHLIPDVDYISKKTQEAILNSSLEKTEKETKKIVDMVVKDFEKNAKKRLSELRDGKDAEITPALIEEITNKVYDLIETPDVDKLLEKKIKELKKEMKFANADDVANEMAQLRQLVQEVKNFKVQGSTGGSLFRLSSLLDIDTKERSSVKAYLKWNDTRKIYEHVEITGGSSLPDQTGQNGKFLTTDGTNPSWASIPGGGDMLASVYDPTNISADAFARANHTGTQTASTISDFDTEVSNNTDVTANTSARHDAVTLAGTPDYITLTGQQLNLGQIDLATDVTGDLPLSNIAQQSAHSVLGRAGAGTGDVAGITMGNDTILGRAGAGNVDDLSATQVRTILNVEDGANNYTNEMAQDAVGGILTDTDTIDFTYNDVANTINADVKPNSITNNEIASETIRTGNIADGQITEAKLSTTVNASLDLADTSLQPSDIGTTVQGYSAVLAGTTASFTTADETKLDGIEAGATANPNAIDNLVEDTTPQLGGNLDVNGNIITSASNGNIVVRPNGTGDITIENSTQDAGIIVQDDGNIYFQNNTFTGYVYLSDLGALELQSASGRNITIGSGNIIRLLTNTEVTGNISVTGTVDGRDVATDGTKLDGIENSADVTDVTNVTASLVPTSTSSDEVSFVIPRTFGTPASPRTANITESLTGAQAGIVQKIYHNSGTAPTFPAGWVRLGSGTYTTSTLNIIYCEWVSGTRVEYWIVQEA